MDFVKGGHKMVVPTMFPWGTTFSRRKGLNCPKNKFLNVLTRKYKGKFCPNQRFFMLLKSSQSVNI